MRFKLIPPAYILSKLDVRSLDALERDGKSYSMEVFFKPAEKYVIALHGRGCFNLLEGIQDFYQDRNIQTISGGACLKEMLTNAIKYGSKNSPIFLGTYLTLDAKVFACNDGGDYFKNTQVKHNWESKIKLNKNQRHTIGHGLGQSMLFAEYNEIFIDTMQGTIYLIQPAIIRLEK